MRRISLWLLLGGLLTALPSLGRAESSPMPFTVSPQSISISALYNGTDLTVTGKAPAGSQVVVRLAGEPVTLQMKEKGRALGVLWMNLDKVAFANAPKVFLVAASNGTPAASVTQLGVPGLASQIAVTAKDADKTKLVSEFLKYQKSEKLYVENAGQVSLGPDVDGQRGFTAVLHLPSRLSPGTYSVEALAVKDGAVAAQSQTAVQASFVGIPKFLAAMAFDHGTLYGILASVIAILGGVVIGRIFSGSKGGAH